ncbi:hypothetical protein [Rhodopseudomonas sp. RCAM05734]|uniref:hypothetical protein n=1 Tax=Rhodopseudomonas sp. RCAM05734 TaxID=3457549 RepID=UPI0040440829
MTTASEAIAAIRGMIEGSLPVHPTTSVALPVSWQGEDAFVLPDQRAPFVYVLFDTVKSSTIEIGGGRGANRHRNPGSATILVFVPLGWGLQYGTDYAEHFAALFRSYRANGITCDAVTVYPGGPGSQIAVPGIENEATGYFWSGCEVEFTFDLIG